MNTPHRRTRADSPEVAALRLVSARQPALAGAVDMQIELLGLQHRVESRLSTPWVDFAPDWVEGRLAAGLPVIRFADIPFEWTEFRLLYRQVADLLHRFDLLEGDQHREIQEHVRSGRPNEADVSAWYGGNPDAPPLEGQAGAVPLGDAVVQVLELAARPFLARVVATTAGRVDLAAWRLRHCPFCGGAPELAVWQSADDGRLVCGRCTGVWAYDPAACVHCGQSDRSALRTFTSPDGVYRFVACDRCRRYMKAYDASAGGRPLMLPVDSIATLPLDAAAQQRGYQP